MGLIFSSFVWAYALAGATGDGWETRFGHEKLLTAIMAYRTIIAVLTTRAWGFYSFWTVRFMLGVGEAGAFPKATAGCKCGFPEGSAGSFRASAMRRVRFGAAVVLLWPSRHDSITVAKSVLRDRWRQLAVAFRSRSFIANAPEEINE